MIDLWICEKVIFRGRTLYYKFILNHSAPESGYFFFLYNINTKEEKVIEFQDLINYDIIGAQGKVYAYYELKCITRHDFEALYLLTYVSSTDINILSLCKVPPIAVIEKDTGLLINRDTRCTQNIIGLIKDEGNFIINRNILSVFVRSSLGAIQIDYGVSDIAKFTKLLMIGD